MAGSVGKEISSCLFARIAVDFSFVISKSSGVGFESWSLASCNYLLMLG